jgi:hypothetical protein
MPKKIKKNKLELSPGLSSNRAINRVCINEYKEYLRFPGAQGAEAPGEGLHGLADHLKLSTHNTTQFKKSKSTENIVAFSSTLSSTFYVS